MRGGVAGAMHGVGRGLPHLLAVCRTGVERTSQGVADAVRRRIRRYPAGYPVFDQFTHAAGRRRDHR